MSTVPTVTISFGDQGIILVSWAGQHEEFHEVLEALGFASRITCEERDQPRIILPSNAFNSFSLDPIDKKLWGIGVDRAEEMLGVVT